jgi:rhodanese-related sulfurtransferase
LVTEPGREEEVVTRLARVGYDYSIGYLKGGFESWRQARKEIDIIDRVSADELAKIISLNGDAHLLDVRKKSEYESEHLIQAENAPLDYMNDSMLKVNKNKLYYVYCAGGYRSMIFVSTLKARGFENLIDIRGGFKELKESGKFNITDYVCPSTLL